MVLIMGIVILSGCGNSNDTTMQDELISMQVELDRLQNELSSLQETSNASPAGNLGYAGNSPIVQAHSIVRWQYTYIDGRIPATNTESARNKSVEEMIEEANRLGADGWKLVITSTVSTAGTTNAYRRDAWVFKRMLP